jgi:hypothetical protein
MFYLYASVCFLNFNTVCRMSNGTLMNKEHFEQGSGQIWLDDVNCTGSELSITQCNHRTWGLHNCDHIRDVGVLCNDNGIYFISNSSMFIFYHLIYIIWQRAMW